MDDFVTNKPAKPDEPLYLPPPEGGWAPETSTAPWDTLYEIRHFLEHPFFSISHQKRDSLERYESRDGKLHVEVKAGDDDLGVATLEDAEILMDVTTGLFPLLMKDPSCREVTFKRCDLLRRLHRNAGGNQYEDDADHDEHRAQRAACGRGDLQLSGQLRVELDEAHHHGAGERLDR